MLTVIIDARGQDSGLPGLLAQLTAGAVDGVVRQVLIVAAPGQAGIADLCEEMGAEAYPTLAQAAAAARAGTLMILPAVLRLRDGWVGALNAHLAAGGQPAVVEGLAGGGLFRRGPRGVLVQRGLFDAAAGQQHVDDVAGLLRRLRLRQRVG